MVSKHFEKVGELLLSAFGKADSADWKPEAHQLWPPYMDGPDQKRKMWLLTSEAWSGSSFCLGVFRGIKEQSDLGLVLKYIIPRAQLRMSLLDTAMVNSQPKQLYSS